MLSNELDHLNSEPLRVALGLFNPHIKSMDAHIGRGHPVNLPFFFLFGVPDESVIDGTILTMEDIVDGTPWRVDYYGKFGAEFFVMLISDEEPNQKAVEDLAGRILAHVAEVA